MMLPFCAQILGVFTELYFLVILISEYEANLNIEKQVFLSS